MSQPPYGPQYGAPVDPYHDQGGWAPPAYPTYGEPSGYQEYPPAEYQQPQYQQPQYQAPQQQPQPTGYYQPPPQPQSGYAPPGYPIGYPTPQPPARGGGGKGLVVLLVVVLAVLLAGGGIGVAYWLSHKSTGTPVTSGSTGPSAAPSSQASPTPAATHTGDLRSYLVAGPSGSRPWPKPLGTDRNLSIDQAAELSSDPKARKDMLQRYGYASGAVQCWIASGGVNVVDVRLYQFDSADHAQSFFRDNIDATGQGYSAGNTATVDGVPDAKSFSDPKKDEQGFVSVISIAVKGDVVFVVSIGEKGGTIDLSVPAKLMQQQYAKL